MSEDPLRWLNDPHDVPDGYEEAAAVFRADGPSDAQLTRMLSTLGAAGVPPFFAGWKLGIACLGGAVLAAALLWPRAQPVPVERTATPIEPARPRISAARSEPEAVNESPAREPEVSSPRKPPARQAAAPAAPDPVAELALLRRARRVLAANPGRTLALTKEHLRAYPGGTFAEERELLTIEALVALGRRAEAERRARAFRAQFGQSIHLQRVESLLAH
jgi:hypothetical protein